MGGYRGYGVVGEFDEGWERVPKCLWEFLGYQKGAE